MARVLGVTSAAISRTTESKNDTTSANKRWICPGMPHDTNRASVRSVVAVEATISARVLVKRTVDRNRLGSALSRCSIAAALLPCSARNLTRRRPIDVSAVSVALASADTTKQTISRITSNHSVAPISDGLAEELADAPVLVYPDDRLREQRCHRQHRDEAGLELVGRDGHGVGDDDLVHLRLLEPLDCVARENGVCRRDQDLSRALVSQRLSQLRDGAAGRDDVLDHDTVSSLYIA